MGQSRCLICLSLVLALLLCVFVYILLWRIWLNLLLMFFHCFFFFFSLLLSFENSVFVLDHAVVSCLVMSDSLWLHGLYLLCPWDFPGKNARVGSHSLLQGIFLTQCMSPALQVDSSPSEPWGMPPYILDMSLLWNMSFAKNYIWVYGLTWFF